MADLDPGADPAPAAPSADPAPADPPASAAPAPAPDPSPAPANDNWRERMAGEDADVLKFLGRYHSETAALKAFKDNHDAIRQGKFIKPLPENATDAEVAEFRKATGVPDKTEDYLTDMPDGLVVGEADKPYVDEFLGKMHAVNAPKGVTQAALQAYFGMVEEQNAQRDQIATEAKDEGIEALRDEWGGDYKRNMTIMDNFVNTLPEPVRDALQYGTDRRTGKPIGYNPEVIKWLTAQALEKNPIATVVPNAGANQAEAIQTEIAGLEKMMGDRESEYWKGPMAAKNQARYLQLVEAKQKLAS